MAQISLSFDLSRIHYDQLPLFLAHAAKLSTIYEQLIAAEPSAEPHYESPPAESLPVPPFPEEASLEEMSGQQLRDRLADLTGNSRGKKQSPKFPTKADLIAEIRRLEGTDPKARTVEERDGTLFVTTDPEQRRMSEDSLAAPAAEGDGAASIASGEKKRGIPKGTKLTEEQKAQRKATREANKAKKTETVTGSA